MKIGKKLLLSYIAILVLSFTLSSISFQYIFRFYTRTQTRLEIKEEGELLAQTLSKKLDSETISSKIQTMQRLKLAGRLLDTYVLVLDKNDKPLYTNTDQATRQEILRSLRLRATAANPYVMERVPITSSDMILGSVIVAAQSKDIDALSPLLFRSELLSFLIAGIIAFMLASWFSRHLTESIDLLRRHMRAFTVKKPYRKTSIRTGDEIEDLSHCFDDLALRLKEYDEGQKTFMQNTSHELKTPLMSIQGYAEAIRDGLVEGEDIEKSLNVIIEESQRLKRTVEEFIFLSKLETSGEFYNFKAHSLTDLVYDVAHRLQALADMLSVQLNIQCQPGQQLCIDREKIFQALTNVVDNCLRYASGKVSLASTSSKTHCMITITDDGPGFAPGEADNIFKRFYKGTHGGSGIGLAISRTVIEGHNGTITAQNHSDGGAQFIIALPLQPDGISGKKQWQEY
ncbi:MAG TPA: HAMP domain-containing sensor histidine kinase [Syntrophomonadaceae bacterium]|nr:HAMP domain-containing sensor histidine kinase [Syntrophomonadaceae bacterium]